MPPYYGPRAHGGPTKYLALDGGAFSGAFSLCERSTYHDGVALARPAGYLVAGAAATGRVLLLPRVHVDYFAYFLWPFLDLSTLPPNVDYRETNFFSNPRAWKNATHPFGSVARVFLGPAVVGVDRGGGESAEWFRVDGAHTPRTTDVWAAALAPHEDAELLLVDLVSTPRAAGSKRGVAPPADLRPIFRRLRFCGKSINLDKMALKNFQNHDCYGVGDLSLPENGGNHLGKRPG